MVSLLIIHRKKHPTYQRADEIAKFLMTSDSFNHKLLLPTNATVVTPTGRLPFMWLQDIFKFKRCCKATFDVCWTDELSVMAFARWLKTFGIAKKVVYEDQDLFPLHYSGVSKLIVYNLELTAMRNADLVISCSEELARLRVKQKARRVEVVPHGVNYQLFRKAYELRMKRVLEPDFKPRTLIYAGSFKTGWAVDLLPYILKRVVDKKPDAVLLLAGYGELSILKNFNELGVTKNVKFLGEVPHDHLPDVFAMADIGLATYTTLAAAYGVPLKIKEYMAAGLPVVASNFKSIAKFINEAKAGAVASADAEELTQVTLNLLSMSRREYIELSTRATDYVRSYDWGNLLKRYESLLISD